MKRATIATTLTALTLALTLVATTGASAAPRPYGASVGTWGARWWEWAFDIPADANHPLFDEEGDDCMRGQASKGFVFLAGVFNTSGTADRDGCTVPVGRGLFFPLVNVECSSLEPDPFFGDDEASLNACLDHWAFTDTFATLDGAPLFTASQRSGVYDIGPMPDPNILGATPGATGISMADGEYGIVPPLPPGTYDLRFGGNYELDGQVVFALDIHYELTVR
jgi:hypothetical protein